VEKSRAEVEKLLSELRIKEEELNLAKGQTKWYRKKASRIQTSLDTEELQRDEGSDEMVKRFVSFLSKAGGLSRLTMFNDEWHENHPDAARLLFGYRSYMEAKLYVDAYFEGEVDVANDPSLNIIVSADGAMRLPELSPFEKCMLCRMFFHCFSQQQIIALCFDRHRTRIGQILKEWAPKWANIGLHFASWM